MLPPFPAPFIAALLVALAAGACASGAANRSPAERLADEQLAARVEQALMADPQIYARHIDIDVERGVVHLSGYVWEDRDLVEARRIAMSVDGVRDVVSQLELQRGGARTR